ncbi:MAG TPA: hypothetical protein VMS45_00935, partial [Gemmatimonadaceae bacterium]|nr:hypothetical protein [Gemmatimonadaceae bacterium]
MRPHLALAKHAEQWPAGLQPWTLPSEPPANPIDLARAMIGAAVLAPSHWNAQPWRFEVEGNSIRVVADFSRALPATDPDRRAEPDRHRAAIGVGGGERPRDGGDAADGVALDLEPPRLRVPVARREHGGADHRAREIDRV